MRAGVGTRQDVREENALIDLDPVLLALHLLALRIDLLARRRKPRHERGHLIGKHIGAYEVCLVRGERAIDRLRVAQHEGFAGLAAGAQDRVGGARLIRVALRLFRQRGEQIVALTPERRVRVGVAFEMSGDPGPRSDP